MAKLEGPLWSLDATGRLGDTIRYARFRGLHRAKVKNPPDAARGLRQRRQAAIISEGARLWRQPGSRGPEPTYQDYVGGLSREGWYFYLDAVLMEWSDEQLLVI